ncbi:sensor domain-containing diguanylate cyclase [Silvibacterium dinghuense]|uniref:GGDEF domain-containing protein n=1 Tax=Silvibacterium dinghuense TaxID=1560006 RepID=A0A4Q1SJL3_9BACT|nr:sensor domain-containing diguanylate cyclase [Silvibacterium dinghuense]RXS97627.1 GGDEF domain-containing protein [Silvibacterium dinghuense]GGH00658.1 hypothetical protein GCM10011586_15300 [Silvibacterium dinghuense]
MKTYNSAILDRKALREIVRTQTEIAKLGMDLGAVMTLAASQVQDLTGAEGAIVELSEAGELVCRAASGITREHLGRRQGLENTLSGLCLSLDEVLYCSDAETDPRLEKDTCRQEGLRSLIVAPLAYDSMTVGALKIFSRTPHAFGDQDISVLAMICEVLAAAMFHAARNQQNELYLRATHDALTDLPNRALFYDRMRQHLEMVKRHGRGLGVLSIDMDCLKQINDRHGHRAGDAAICEIANRMRNSLRESDTVARLGGDEFGVLLCEAESRASTQETAQRLSAFVCKPFRFEDLELPLGASIGLAFSPEDGEEPELLLDTADRSMYAMKRERKNQSEKGNANFVPSV